MPAPEDHKLLPASKILPGMVLDLEGDAYADPESEDVRFAFEFMEVWTVEQETPDCVALGFDGHLIGFPTDHLLKVVEDLSAERAAEAAELDPTG